MSVQLCFSCQKACDPLKCIWAGTLEKYPEGAVLDNEGTIVSCPEYLKDPPEVMFRAMGTKQRMKYLNMSNFNLYMEYKDELDDICKNLFIAGHPPLKKGELRWNRRDLQFELHLKET